MSLITELAETNGACSGNCWDCTLACASEDTDDLEAEHGDRIELP